MVWLEMSRNEKHGGGNWGFGKCLWSPTKKTNGKKWAFWETVHKVREGNLVIHLSGKAKPAFVGYSIAETDGYETNKRPPDPEEWGYADSFYRVELKDFIPFPSPIDLRSVFTDRDRELRTYFSRNRELASTQKERLFYVIQSGRLQCLNGAYLSEISNELMEILFPESIGIYSIKESSYSIIREVDTGEVLSQLKTRIGQQEFSEKVRNNYNNICCFPECEIAERSFLVGAHITRWTDNRELRGDLANGLCLCLMHDKAFEKGLFTLDLDFNIWSDTHKLKESDWGMNNILPHNGSPIKLGKISPSQDAILEHWERVSLYPQ